MLHHRAEQAAQLAERLGRSTGDAVRSLQFEDIVRQVAEHADKRMGQVLDVLDGLLAYLDAGAPEDRADARASIVAAIDDRRCS
jgi:hypothetical protein